MQDLDQILLDDRVEAWKEFDINELKDKLAKLAKLAEYSSSSSKYAILSDKLLSFDCLDTQLRLKDESSGSQFCIIPSKLQVTITRHMKEHALNQREWLFDDSRVMIDIEAIDIAGFIIKDVYESDVHGRISEDSSMLDEKNITTKVLRLVIVLQNLNVDSIIQWVKIFNKNLEKEDKTESNRITRSIRSTIKNIIHKPIDVRIKIEDVFEKFKKQSANAFNYPKPFTYSKDQGMNERCNRIIINCLENVEICVDENKFASLMTLIDAFIEKKQNQKVDEQFRNFQKQEGRSETKKIIDDSLNELQDQDQTKNCIYKHHFFNVEHIQVVIKQIDIITQLKGKELTYTPFLELKCKGFSVDVDKQHSSHEINLNLVNNLVLIFQSLEIKNLREDNYLFNQQDDEKDTAKVNTLKTNPMFNNEIKTHPMRFLEFSIEPQAMDPNFLQIQLGKRFKSSCLQLMEIMEDSESLCERTPSQVLMKSDTVWTKLMDMPVYGAESKMVALNVVHLFRSCIGDCMLNLNFNLLVNCNEFLYPVRQNVTNKNKPVLRAEVFKSQYRQFSINKTKIMLILSSKTGEELRNRTELLQTDDVKIKYVYLQDSELGYKLIQNYRNVLGQFARQLSYQLFNQYNDK